MKRTIVICFATLGATAVYAQPSIQIGPGGVQVSPGGPREERIVREEGGCRITTIRRFDEATGRRTVRRIRECDDDED